jgi:general secretion pathway protein F
MPIFEYQALNAAGKFIRGVIDADTPRIARSKLREEGIHPIELHEESRSSVQGGFLFRFFGRIGSKDLALASRQLATLTEAGIPLTPSLSALIEQLGNPELRKIFIQVREKVSEGNSFAEALGLYPSVFPKIFIGLVRSGEMSGALGPTLGNWADLSEQQVALHQRIRAAMAYPVFMFFIGVIVIFALMAFVVPSVTQIFTEFGRALPLPTRILIFLSQFLSRYWWALLGGALIIFIWLRKITQREPGSLILDRVKMGIPLAGNLHKKLAISRWSRTLETLLQAGIPLYQAIEISQGVIGNRIFSRAIATVRERIREGETMTQSLRESGLFPPMVLEMTAVGEKSGELGKMLGKTAQTFEREVETHLRSLISLLEPMMILIMGLGVGFIAVSILLPILELSQVIR